MIDRWRAYYLDLTSIVIFFFRSFYDLVVIEGDDYYLDTQYEKILIRMGTIFFSEPLRADLL